MALRLVKRGYYQGDIRKVLEARVDDVMLCWEYEGFLDVFEETFSVMQEGTK